MPYRVLVGGVQVETDTLEEAVDLAKRIGRGPLAKSLPSEKPTNESSRWTEARIKEFRENIGDRQRLLVGVLLENPDGRTDTQLLQHLGLKDGRELAGVFTGLWKNAKKSGADPNDLYEKRPTNLNTRGKRTYEYFLTDSFRSAAERFREKK